MANPHVIILGGGVAGMSAAHELIHRGFRVTVYEREPIPGGKARSFGVKNTATAGRSALPAEHGFRFFPGFYRHLPDTMKRIPYRNNRNGVFDNLVDATEMLIQFKGRQHLVVPSRFPRSLGDVSAVLRASGYLTTNSGLNPEDIEFYSERVWQLLTSCEERRAAELEGVAWWDYIDADNPSRAPEYKEYLARTPRVLVAADPKKANTKTVGDILVQLLFNLLDPGVAADRVLNGPTNEVWIDPWLQHLEAKGVTYKRDSTVVAFQSAGGRITGVRISEGGVERVETADYYVAALPVEKMAGLVTPTMVALDPALDRIKELALHVDWMSGIQFYLVNEVPIACGHQMLLSTPWALTSISQAQFWGGAADFQRRYGDGTVRTVLSVDVSDWKKGVGSNGKVAIDCTLQEVADEVWQQIKDTLGLVDSDLHPTTPWALDPAIKPGVGKLTNSEELLVNEPNTWVTRPWARTRIPNLFLAADYVRTYTNLATMEAANEAARRAVNAIIDASGVGAAPCELWQLHEPVWVKPWRWWDLIRYRRGEPWGGAFPDFVQSMALAVLEGAPSIGGTEEYADASARSTIENGIGVVPAEIQQEAVDVVLGLASALDDGNVAKARMLFASDADVRVLGRRIPAESLLAGLAPFLASGGHVTVDVRSLEDIRPSGRHVVARFTTGLEVLGGPDPLRDTLGLLEVALAREEAQSGVQTDRWLIHGVRYRPEPKMDAQAADREAY